jgi:hypothetical protein
VTEPIFWLTCSLTLVAVCLTAVLATAVPALKELARASRSAERLFDTLYRELPPTLEAIRLTGTEISDLSDELSEGVETAGNVVKQVDQSLRGAQRQILGAGLTTRSIASGIRVAWQSFTQPRRAYKPSKFHSDASGSTPVPRSTLHRPAPEQQTPVPYEPSWRSESAAVPFTSEEQSTATPPSELTDP